MDKITLNTETYLIRGKENERFFPFLELGINEWVIYENDAPKYFIELNIDIESEFTINNWLVAELKNGRDLRDLIIELGKEYGKKWDIFSSYNGMEVENSYQTESIDLELLTDNAIDKINNILSANS